MTIVITRFPLPANVNPHEMNRAFADVAPAFRGVPGLLRKQFLLSADCRSAGGVYLWETEAAARAFMQERVAPMIREKFGVEPVIEFYDSPVVVENVQRGAGRIRPAPGRTGAAQAGAGDADGVLEATQSEPSAVTGEP